MTDEQTISLTLTMKDVKRIFLALSNNVNSAWRINQENSYNAKTLSPDTAALVNITGVNGEDYADILDEGKSVRAAFASAYRWALAEADENINPFDETIDLYRLTGIIN